MLEQCIRRGRRPGVLRPERDYAGGDRDRSMILDALGADARGADGASAKLLQAVCRAAALAFFFYLPGSGDYGRTGPGDPSPRRERGRWPPRDGPGARWFGPRNEKESLDREKHGLPTISGPGLAAHDRASLSSIAAEPSVVRQIVRGGRKNHADPKLCCYESRPTPFYYRRAMRRKPPIINGRGPAVPILAWIRHV